MRRSVEMQDTSRQRSNCPGCGEPIGIYEMLWRIAPDVGAERTSWLRLGPRDATLETLWHASCAETLGVEGG
jgi:hypothetical protein